ncbi:MAG: transporter [Pseudopedobacter saltans]|uniref:Transporter n=1 Tax=Pseudopedobacter saltans TaxID=151895 RepID=A0A2W5H8V5_9SPHI|nr:MAG: transporter [Pseudopedobacter saltans]
MLSFFLTVSFYANAQVDTAKIFSIKDLQEAVLTNHPIVKQAYLLKDAAQTRIKQALGKFDPKLESSFARKQFGNNDYYSNWQNELKVPLWLAGADLKLSYDKNYGEYTNPQYYTGRDGLGGLGLNIPIGQGLIIDERRNTLKQAKTMARYADADQVKQILTVWFDAVKDYWNWYYTYQQYVLIKEGVQLADVRYNAIVKQAVLGDKPAIDSVEAFIMVQDRKIQLTKLEVELQNASIVLSNYLWGEDNSPVELPSYAVPQSPDSTYNELERVKLGSLMEYALNSHPEILKLNAKGEQYDLEQAFRKEMLKPKVDISGSLLTRRNTFGDYNPGQYDFRWENYKVGVNVVFPLFLRAERGKLEEARIKRKEVDYDLFQMNRNINNTITTSYNMLVGYKRQLLQQDQNLQNQQLLLTAELQKYELGESTLFLINNRETKLIDMKVKKEDLLSSYQKKIAEIYYKAGTMQDSEIPKM